MPQKLPAFVKDDLIFMTVAGSRMYGTNTPDSDIDLRGVCVPPKNVLMGFARNFEQQTYENEDTVVFSLMKFVKLCADNNPNIIELLFAPEDCIRTITPTWERLLERRDEFISAKCYHSFSGYAHQQLARLKGHRAWLRDPPDHQPTRQEFGLTQSGQGVREISKGVDVSEIAPEALVVIEKEKRYKAAMRRWKDYQRWIKERNPARAKLEAAHGYDTKHALHLVRLLRMGHEILTTGKVIVRRPDAEELLAIRNGCYTYDELMEVVEPLRIKMDKINTDKSYVVPFGPPKVELSDFAVELHEFHWTHHHKA
jgi:predicted nucleotidyltransferase